jgi:hypothetical protein
VTASALDGTSRRLWVGLGSYAPADPTHGATTQTGVTEPAPPSETGRCPKWGAACTPATLPNLLEDIDLRVLLGS